MGAQVVASANQQASKGWFVGEAPMAARIWRSADRLPRRRRPERQSGQRCSWVWIDAAPQVPPVYLL